MIRIVIADDEVETRNNIIDSIVWEQYDYSLVGVASNGEDAFAVIKKMKPDIAILDIYMPKMDGLEVVKRCIEEMDTPPAVVLISGFDDLEFAHKAIRLHVDEYLLKPFRPKDLLETLAKISSRITKNSVFPDMEQPIIDELSYSLELERMVLTAISGGLREDVVDSVSKFIETCIKSQPVREATHNAALLCSSIQRMILERIKTNTLVNPILNRNWSTGNIIFLREELNNYALSAFDLLEEGNQRSAVIMNAIRYIDQNFHQHLTLQKIADSVYISAPYLSKLFKQKMGINLMAYLHSVRLEKAKELLADPNLSVMVIAERVGYSNEKVFIQKFKQYNAMTPSQFRFKRIK